MCVGVYVYTSCTHVQMHGITKADKCVHAHV